MENSQVVKELGYLSDNNQSVLKACQERKYKGWESLKNWNEMTKHTTRISLNFLNELHLRILNLMQKSTNRIDTISQFLEKMTIVLMSEIRLKDHLDLFSLNDIGDSSQIEKIKLAGQRENEPILHAMMEFNREYSIFSEKLEDLSGRIKTDIVKNILKKQVILATESLNKVLLMYNTMKKSMLKQNNRMVDKIKKLNKTFQVKNVPKDRLKAVKFNSFDAASEFVSSVKEVDQTIDKLGNFLVDIWNHCIILEEKRLNAMKDAMAKFLDILIEVYGSEAQRTFKNRYFF